MAPEPLGGRLTMIHDRGETIYQKGGDTLPIFEAVLYTPGGAVVDLTEATAAALVRRLPAAGSTVTRTVMTFVLPKTSGRVRCTPAALSPGLYRQEVEITWPTGVETFPNGGWQTVVVCEDLD
jgi:hypothetical protein